MSGFSLFPGTGKNVEYVGTDLGGQAGVWVLWEFSFDVFSFFSNIESKGINWEWVGEDVLKDGGEIHKYEIAV